MFLEILKAIIYGIVEGITEWLPISSTGHLILLEQLLPLKASDAFMSMFDVVIQLGAILAVIVLFFHKLNPFSGKKSPREKRQTWDLWFKVIVAVLPSVVLGLLLDDWLDAHLYNHVVVAIMLIVYGVAFIAVEQYNRKRRPAIRSTNQITYKTALLVGCCQVLAMIPGYVPFRRNHSRRHSAGHEPDGGRRVLLLPGHSYHGGGQRTEDSQVHPEGRYHERSEWACLIVASVVAFVVSLLAIRSLMNYVKRHNFSAFGIYRILLGIIVLVVYFVTK